MLFHKLTTQHFCWTT